MRRILEKVQGAVRSGRSCGHASGGPARGLATALGVVALLASAPADAARRERLDLELVQIPLAGQPVDLIPADLDGDGIGDLVLALAYTRWDRISVSETVAMDDVDGLVEMMTVVPALADERRLVVLLGRPEGGFAPLGDGFELPLDVLSLEPGPPGFPVLAITDAGLATLRLRDEGDAPDVVFEVIHEETPLLAGSELLLPRLSVVQDLDGDEVPDVLFPMRDAYRVLLWRDGELVVQPELAQLPPRGELTRRVRERMFPLPKVGDVDGDGLPDLLFPHPQSHWNRFWVGRNLGEGRFGEPFEPLGGPWDEVSQRLFEGSRTDEVISIDEASEEGDQRPTRNLSFFGDLDGDGYGEYVDEQLHYDPGGLRKEMRQAKNPRFTYRIHGAAPGTLERGEEEQTFESLGYAFEGSEDDYDFVLPGGFSDLNGDGRMDLVSLTLDFSLLQVVRVLASKSLSIGLDFHVRCQEADGTFRLVEGMDLAGKFKVDFRDLRVGQLSQFAGDFDGDGIRDFVQIGRGRDVSIHRGTAGCGYPKRADLLLRLKEEPRNLGLVRVDDFDLDGLADLLVIQPQPAELDGSTQPVRVDLYSSRRVESP